MITALRALGDIASLPSAPRLGLLGEEAKMLAELHAKCFNTAWDESAFINLLENGGFGWCLFNLEFKIIAFILLRNAAMETEILTLATHPDHQRKGLATQLLQHCRAELPTHNIEEIFLEVRADNLAAQKLYSACGFTEIARRPAYYALPDGSCMDALVLKRRVGSG